MKHNKLGQGIFLAVLSAFIIYIMIYGIISSKSNESFFRNGFWEGGKLIHIGNINDDWDDEDNTYDFDDYKSEYEYCYNINDFSKINISLVSEDVYIHEGNSDEVKVCFVGNWKNSNPVSEITDDTLFIKRLKSVKYKKRRILKVYLPANYCKNIEIRTTSGDISFSVKENENISIETVSGDINLNFSNAADITIKTTSGDSKIYGGTCSRFLAKSVSGDSIITNLKCSDFESNTTSGDFRITGELESFNIKSISGDINITINQELLSNSEITTTSGDIVFTNNSDYSYMYDTKTKSGSYRMNNSKPKMSDYTVKLSSINGDITIR